MPIKRFTRRGALALGAGLLAAPHVRAEATRKVSFASVGGVTDAPLSLGHVMGFFAEAGLDVQMQKLSSAPDLMAATASSQVDVAGISTTPGLFASVQRGVSLRIVGDKQSIRPGFSATRLIARPEFVKATDAETAAALRGRKIAVSARPSCVFMLLEDYLKTHGMSLNDVDVVELSYPNMMPALSSGAVDATVNLEPFMTKALQAGLARDVCDFTAFVPAKGGTIVPLVYSESFAADRARAQDFMTAYVRGVRVYNDAFAKGLNRDQVIDIIAREAGVPVAVVRDSFPAGLDPEQRVDRPFVDRVQHFFIAQKFLRQPADLNTLVDTSFAEAALKTLGPYS